MSVLTPESVNAFLATAFPGADGVSCDALGDRTATARWTHDPGSLRPGGLISGPTQFALADSALWFALFTAVGEIEAMAVTSELSIRFLRPAAGGDLMARASIQSVSRRRVVGTVELWVEGTEERVSVAQGTYVRPRVSPETL